MKGDPRPQPQEECLMLEEGRPAGPPVGHTVLALSPRGKGAVLGLHEGGGAQTAPSWTRHAKPVVASGHTLSRPAGRTEQLAPLCGTGRATPRREATASVFTDAPRAPAWCRERAHLSALWFLSTPTPTPTPTHTYSPHLPGQAQELPGGWERACLFYLYEAEADGRARPRHAVCYTTYAFVPLCSVRGIDQSKR